MKINNKAYPLRAFTLIEVTVVVAIIGILATVILTNLNEARALARDEVRIAELEQIAVALNLYKVNHGSYPARQEKIGDGAGTLEADLAPYLPTIPSDPLNDATYYYYYDYDADCEDAGSTQDVAVVSAVTMETMTTNQAEFCPDELTTADGSNDADAHHFVVGLSN